MMDGGSVRVLHVDDEEQFGNLTRSQLEAARESFEVRRAQNGRDALDILESTAIDCIVSDYDMPRMTGLELLERVRERYPDLPFILFTGKGSEEIASEAVSAGVTDYLQKSGTAEQYEILSNRIQNAVSKRRAERRLAEEREFIERALDTLPDVFMALDATGQPVRWNDRVNEVTGYTDEAIQDLELTEFFPPEDRDYVETQVQELIETGENTMEVNLLTSDGERIPHEFRGATLTDNQGEFAGIVGVGRNVSDRLARKRELEAYETMIQTVPDGVFLLDENATMLRVNDAWADIVGYEKTDLEGMPFPKLVEAGVADEAVAEQYVDLLRDLLSSENDRKRGTFHTEVQPPTADEPRTYEVHIALLPYDEEFQGTVGVVRDVTEQIDRRRELEHKNERLEEFASVVSHDLQAPLSVARGRVELATEQEGVDSDHLDRAIDAHERMEALIDDLLALARHGTDAASLTPTSLADVARDAWATISMADAALEIRADATVQADPGQLQQLFENLLRNAVEHAGPDVTIWVDTTEHGFVVADDGPGIPENRRETVRQYGTSGTEGGTGFGLAIVEEIATDHGWEMTIRDSDAGGAEIAFRGVERQDE